MFARATRPAIGCQVKENGKRFRPAEQAVRKTIRLAVRLRVAQADLAQRGEFQH
jgi:hypothetical protein